MTTIEGHRSSKELFKDSNKIEKMHLSHFPEIITLENSEISIRQQHPSYPHFINDSFPDILNALLLLLFSYYSG